MENFTVFLINHNACILLLPLLHLLNRSLLSSPPRDDGDFSQKASKQREEKEEAALKRRENSGEHGRGRRGVINQKLGCRRGGRPEGASRPGRIGMSCAGLALLIVGSKLHSI